MAAGKAVGGVDPWSALRAFTDARIALGRAGGSLSAAARLEFLAAHAGARDAVHFPMDVQSLVAAIGTRGWGSLPVASAAESRTIYLQRPDLGRQLDGPSRQYLQDESAAGASCDVAFVIADGLSGLAVNQHALALLDLLYPRLTASGLRIAPIVVASQARVAIGDEAGALLGVRLVVVLVGERPGLSAADSLGAYMTCRPRVGCTDADRNCVSNIRPAGLQYHAAADKLHWLVGEALRLGISGVALKDRHGALSDTAGGNTATLDSL